MAITVIASLRANSGITTAVGANTITLINPNLISLGNTLLLSVYAQNNTSHVPAIGGGATITDPRGNVWVPLGGADSWNNSGATGGALQIYKCLVLNSYLAGDNLSIVGQVASLIATFQIREFSGVSQASHPVGTFTNVGFNPTGSIALPITVQAAGQMVFVAGGAGTTSAITGDSDTLDGSWSGPVLKTQAPIDGWQEFKVLTAFTNATQNYSAAWTSIGGDNTWGQVAIVLDPLTPGGGGSLTQLFPPQDNPNYACPDSGFEPLPNGNAKLPIDTGTAYQIRHTIPTYSAGTHAYSVLAQYDGTEPAIQQHHVAYDLYQTGSEVPQDVITQLTFPVGSVTISGLSGGTPGVRVLANDGSTVLASSTATETVNAAALTALQTSGNSFIQMNTQTGGSTFIGVRFDLTNGQYNISNYPNVRIIRMGVRYVGWKDNSSTVSIPAGEGLDFSYRPTIAGSTYEVELGAWLVPDYRRSAGEQIRWFGETNPMPAVPSATSYYGPSTGAWFRTPPDAGTSWSIVDLVNLSTTNPNFIRVYPMAGADTTQTLAYLDYMELVVEIAPERRLGNVVQNVSTSTVYGTGPLPSSQYDPNRAAILQVQNVRDQSIPLTVTGSPNDYTLVAREALPASTSDYYPALASAPSAPNVAGVPPTSFAGIFLACPMEAIGPSLDFLGYTRARPMSPDQRPLTERTVVDGVFGSGATSLNQYQLSFGALDQANYLAVGSFFPVFQGMAPLYWQSIYASSAANQKFYTGASATYDLVQIVAQPDPLTTAVLLITDTTNSRTATVTVADALAGEALGNGWFRVTEPWSATWSGTGVHNFQMSSTTAPTAPWRVATLNAVGTGPTLGLGSPIASFEPLAGNGGIAYALVAECTMAAISAVVASQTVTFTPPSHNSCLTATTATLPSLTLTNGGSYSWMVIERSLGNAGPWTIVKKISAPINGQVVLDYEVPWDAPQLDASLAVNYRFTAYRNSDRRSVTATIAWAGTSVNPGAAFALASNELNAMVLYVPVDSGDLQIKWNALNPVSYIPQHMRDFQYALRIPENRGMQVDMDIEVNQFTPCLLPASAGYASYVTEMLTYYSEQLGSGRYAMSPRPFEVSLLPVFNSTAVWTLKLPGGHTRKVSMSLGEMTITTINGMYMASLSLTDVPPSNTNPYTVN